MRCPTNKSIATFVHQQIMFIFGVASAIFQIIAAKTVSKNIGLNTKRFVKHWKLQIIYIGKIIIIK